MIVDVHTHAFPPAMIERRAQLAALDPGFAELYADPRARMATADELLASMQRAAVDVAVAAGFWWRRRELAEEHAAYLLEAAAAADGRLLPFLPQPGPREPVAGVAWYGLGELRLGFGEGAPADGRSAARSEARAVADAAAAADIPLLVHSSEEVGHRYPGKAGGLTPGALWELCTHSSARIIAAHWGGGFPFYALMPEVRALLDEGRLVFDTAASPLLYEPAVFRTAIDLLGVDLVLWGSDFPLRDQAADRAAVEAALPDAVERAAVLGENATRFLRLSARPRAG